MNPVMRHLRSTLLVSLFFIIGSHVNGQSFAQLIGRLNSLPENQRQAVADSFLHAGHSFPYIEGDTLAHVIYNSAAQSVSLAGDATGWNPSQPFTNIGGTTFWYCSNTYEPDARLDYKIVTNGSNWILDPMNPHTCSGGFGPNSELRMPAYQVPPAISFYPAIPHGTITDTTFHSSILNNNRQVRIYLPPGYPSGSEAYPVMLFHDGPEYVSLGSANNILDYLVSEHLMTPVIGIFVPPVDRVAEYAGSKIDKFTDFIVTELMPVIDANYKTSKDPARRGMAGASDGGNISLYIGMKHPELFGKIAAQSSDVIASISETFANGPKLNLELYLDIGTYDIAMLIPMVHNLCATLTAKQYAYQCHDWHEGHSWGNWKGHLQLPLMQFFPWSSGINERPGTTVPKLLPNRPNPFLDHTLIPFCAPVGSNIQLTLMDMSGRVVETIFSGRVSRLDNRIDFNHKITAGEYIITLRQDDILTDSMIIRAL